MKKSQFNQCIHTKLPYVTCGLTKLNLWNYILLLPSNRFVLNEYVYLYTRCVCSRFILCPVCPDTVKSFLLSSMPPFAEVKSSYIHILTYARGLYFNPSNFVHRLAKKREGMNGYSVSDTRAQNENCSNTHRYDTVVCVTRMG